LMLKGVTKKIAQKSDSSLNEKRTSITRLWPILTHHINFIGANPAA
jgi:hypothetical protein